MNKYVVVFYNRFVNKIQTYKTTAENEVDAKDKFYERYPSSAYGDDCIETIETLNDDDKKLELNNDELKRIAEKWYFAWNMEGNGSKEDTALSNKIREHLKKEGVLQTSQKIIKRS
ncbi:hypothetical protein [Bacillus thuringiensis]|uniref:Uncharacterized protein n=1 Tax=Bacillus thuringiensis TaxID=1428 RepID=A0A9X6VCF9_BACTU|nr:hypothetical protein [Bacillus thuringiensis]MEC3269946.1 hypothetical protein [Bacillus thuringiensis]PFB07998.1 hypothetical protein CN398_09740 [Bacillus thuringiensis]